MRVLVVVAHPDDECNGMGGTIVRLLSAGHEVQVVVMTRHPRDGERREAEATAAAHLVGAASPRFLNEPDGDLRVAADVQRKLAASLVPEPDAVFTLWGIDVHPDHRNTSSLVLNHCLRRGVDTELYCMEVCASGRSSTSIRPQSLAFRPTHYVDVTDVWNLKKAMQACHASQDPDGMWAGVESMMRNRGRESGFQFAEAFVRLTRSGAAPAWIEALFIPTRYRLPRGIGADFDEGQAVTDPPRN